MSVIKHNETLAEKRKKRVRSKMMGTAERPRLTILRSNEHISLQAIDDEAGKTLAAASDLGKTKIAGTKSERTAKVTAELVKGLKKANISKLQFDRGSYKYHGRVKVVAEALRAEGINV